MRITFPWGGVALIGGTIVLTMTDWPSIVGWVGVVWGILTLILQVIFVITLQATLRMAKQLAPEDFQKMVKKEINDKTYKTNHGRILPVRPTSKQS
jgi:hypothetical protein